MRVAAGHRITTFRGAARASLVTGALPLHRRSALLLGATGLLDGLLGPEIQPKTGSCPTCIGVVDGTLGSCAGIQACVSSYDDRPGWFVAPWEHEERSPQEAARVLQSAIKATGGEVEAYEEQKDAYTYVRASYRGPLGQDDLEFLIPAGDTTVELRAASRRPQLPDGGRLEGRLEDLRAVCGWEVVPVLRNRKRVLGIVETPWDSFGPTPPAGLDYDNLRLSDVLGEEPYGE